MKQTISGGRIPIKVWTDYVEEGALQQAKNLADLPFACKWIALMPDVHQGFGMPIGGVLVAEDTVIPNAVGVDIGCGVRAVKTNLTVDGFKSYRDRVLNDILAAVPVGFKHHKHPQNHPIFQKYTDVTDFIAAQWDSVKCQLGTLGGGNHFIEIQADEEHFIWIMLHCGSRNLGKQVAGHYNKLAKKLNKARHLPVPPEYQLAYLPIDSQEGKDYWRDMTFCINFAEANRQRIMEIVLGIFEAYFPQFEYDPGTETDVRHNYAAQETHYGKDLIVHRKGAVRAKGRVIIPGSMGTPSYIGQGLANPEAFESCSHGAGRKMSRSKAKKEISVKNVIQEMEKKDIALVKPKNNDVAEECSQAYKDIDEVMDNQKDLVAVTIKLTPVGVIKG